MTSLETLGSFCNFSASRYAPLPLAARLLPSCLEDTAVLRSPTGVRLKPNGCVLDVMPLPQATAHPRPSSPPLLTSARLAPSHLRKWSLQARCSVGLHPAHSASFAGFIPGSFRTSLPSLLGARPPSTSSPRPGGPSHAAAGEMQTSNLICPKPDYLSLPPRSALPRAVRPMLCTSFLIPSVSSLIRSGSVLEICPPPNLPSGQATTKKHLHRSPIICQLKFIQVLQDRALISS